MFDMNSLKKITDEVPEDMKEKLKDSTMEKLGLSKSGSGKSSEESRRQLRLVPLRCGTSPNGSMTASDVQANDVQANDPKAGVGSTRRTRITAASVEQAPAQA